jgi:SAM-dependent methyltransferase
MPLPEVIKSSLHEDQLKRLRRMLRPAWLGSLRRTTPISRHWGFDRGTPVDRHYIAQFLTAHGSDIRGRVLEIKDDHCASRFGSNVTDIDILDIDSTNQRATIIGDLSRADSLPADAYDCFLLIQTLQLIPETKAAILNTHRILKPGGVLLATVPFISKLANGPGESDYWRFTERCCSNLFGSVYGDGNVSIGRAGNVLAAIAFLAGMAAEELSAAELDSSDLEYPLIITVRARKR